MNKKLIPIISVFAVSLLGSCDSNKLSASFNEYLVDKVTVGTTINFADAIDYEDGAEVKITYSTDDESDIETDSLYFLTDTVGMHHFTFTFSKDGASASLSCDIDVVPLAPSIEQTNIAVYFNKNETVTFDDLFMKSGIDAMPFGYVNTKFKYVDYYQCFSQESVKLETNSIQAVRKNFTNETSYTFENYGKYLFEVEIYNSQGSVATTIQASVFEEYAGEISGYSFEGLVKGNDNNVVELVKSNNSNILSYIAKSDAIEISNENMYTLSCEFVGKKAPQIMLGFDSLNGDKYLGSGYIISLEEDQKNQFGIFGPNRLNNTNLSPSRSEGNTISKNSLQDGNTYKWDVIFRLTESASGDTNLAIMSNLYKNGNTSPYRVYKWASTKTDIFSGGKYYGFLGSSAEDIIIKYSPLSVTAI